MSPARPAGSDERLIPMSSLRTADDIGAGRTRTLARRAEFRRRRPRSGGQRTRAHGRRKFRVDRKTGFQRAGIMHASGHRAGSPGSSTFKSVSVPFRRTIRGQDEIRFTGGADSKTAAEHESSAAVSFTARKLRRITSADAAPARAAVRAEPAAVCRRTSRNAS